MVNDLICKPLAVLYSTKATYLEGLVHCPSIKIVGVVIENMDGGLSRIIALDSWVAGSCAILQHHKEMLVLISHLSLVGSYSAVMLKASGWPAIPSLSRDASRNCVLSMKQSFAWENEMYFSVLFEEARGAAFLTLKWPSSAGESPVGYGTPWGWLLSWGPAIILDCRHRWAAPGIFWDVAVVTHRVSLKGLLTDMAICGRVVGISVLLCHPHGLWVWKCALNIMLLLLHGLQKRLAALGPWYLTDGCVWPSHRTPM